MDSANFDQIPIGADKVGDTLKFVKENMICKVLSYKGDVFGIEPPIFVELEITDCEPGVKGDTAQSATKAAIVETGATVRVPLFVNQGETIRIDTRTGEYLERV
jgi:elongation factor P